METPQRIASLLASATEMLHSIGLGDRLVAISHECDYPSQVLSLPRVTRANVNSEAASGAIDVEVRQMLTEGSALYEIDEAVLASLAPDLIITQAQCDVCAVRYEDVLATVERNTTLRQAQVVALNPLTLPEIFADIERVGQATGCEEAAARYVASLTARVEAVRNKTSRLTSSERPRVALVEWVEPLMLAGNWMPEVLSIAGGMQALATAGQHSTYTDWDAVCQYDPEVVVVMPCGFGLERTLLEARALQKLPGWRALTAVKSGRVYAADGNAYFNRSGPRIVDSLEILAHLIHPQLFPASTVGIRGKVPWQRLD